MEEELTKKLDAAIQLKKMDPEAYETVMNYIFAVIGYISQDQTKRQE